MRRQQSAIMQSIPARPLKLAGMSILRVLPTIQRRRVGPFVFMDQGGPMTIKKAFAKGVPEHPHAGLSTFTYLLEGAVTHRDSAGHEALVRSGDIALMTAGSGLSHEEIPFFSAGQAQHRMCFAQMWLALPDHLEEMDPTFEHHAKDTLPIVNQEHASATVAMGHVWGNSAPTTCYASTFFTDIRLQNSGRISLSADYEEQALFLLEGTAQIGDIELLPHVLYIVHGKGDHLQSKHGCRALYFGGDTFAARRWMGGNFVASSRAKLDDWMRRSQTADWPRIHTIKN